MTVKKTAQPVQARSQKTRDSILQAALSMYAKKGYHKTTVDEIAAEAGVSTGIAYRYFRNKKDMLLAAISYAADNIGSIAGTDELCIPEDPKDMQGYLTALLKDFEKLHIKYRDIHEEIEGLQHTDEDVRKLYITMTDEKMTGAIAKLSAFMADDRNIREKAYSAVGIMEQHCHMMMNSELYRLDTDVMRDITVNAVIGVLGS